MRIGQLAKAVGCTIETIRFYEKQGVLPKPERGANNFRRYSEEHLRCLSFICYCRSLDMSLKEIKMLLSLEHSGEEQAQEIDSLLERHIQEVAKRIHELDHLRIELIRLRQRCSELTGVSLTKGLFRTDKVRFRKIK
ncbi:DNA-binding transcriptional MerR regulator [Mesocricetibacter intestinalis]|uniref:DNA-binding transcriptional MerR regulator n=1 Tax=Mesocricetibacter intestinalis TaxID=1521930 RepID=A0A4R6V8Y8_9PAST|nr:MerR family transcriptional regulator [Mesocricetibacter intestinalis]TDQ58111.1 DNA-binding transcriptional MerR regulator [Mesocricetibacter intestinalis]